MKASNKFEVELFQQGYKYIVGVDEAGTGSLAGDAWVGGVIFDPQIDYENLLPGLNDSKQKTEEQREELYPLIKKYAICFSTEVISLSEINELNVYWAKFAAIKRMLQKMNVSPDYILMDGNHQIRDIEIPQTAIVKGDAKSISIAAASILAKVERDNYIKKLSSEVNSDYGWYINKAYYTKEHVEAIKKYGKTKYHRKNFMKDIY